jgi:hypothetical protein
VPTLQELIKDDMIDEDEVVDDYEVVIPRMEDEAVLIVRLYCASGRMYTLKHKVCEGLMP